jgi:hypothetical protein
MIHVSMDPALEGGGICLAVALSMYALIFKEIYISSN